MKNHRFHKCFILLLFATFSWSTVGAQIEEIDNLRDVYFKQIRKVSLPVDKSYGQRLVKLQKELIAENNLEEALVVKKEIERLKAKITGKPVQAPPAVEQTETKERMSDTKTSGDEQGRDFVWHGDFQRKIIDGEEVIYMKADPDKDVFIWTDLEDVQKIYPNGATWRFLYRTENYSGVGIDVVFEFPGLSVRRRIGSALRPNGLWIERTYKVTEFKGEDDVKYQLRLLQGTGEVYIKEIELRPN